MTVLVLTLLEWLAVAGAGFFAMHALLVSAGHWPAALIMLATAAAVRCATRRRDRALFVDAICAIVMPPRGAK